MRVVNFADGFTMEKPPMTSGAVQEQFELLNNMFNWTEIENFSFDKDEVSSASVDMEIERYVTFDESVATYRQRIKFDLFYTGSEWQLFKGQYSGEDLWKDETEGYENDQDVMFKIDSTTGKVYYKSNYLVVDTHEGVFKTATIRMKA